MDDAGDCDHDWQVETIDVAKVEMIDMAMAADPDTGARLSDAWSEYRCSKCDAVSLVGPGDLPD